MRALRLGVGLAMVMAASTALTQSIGMLAPFLVRDLGASVLEIGLMPASAFLVGSLTGPAVGRSVDRVRLDRAILATMTIALVTTLLAAVAPNIAVVGVAAALGGLGMTAGNPLTNKLVRELASARQHGRLVGVKQSGVPVAGFLLGAVLPTVAVAASWRVAIACTGALAVIAAAAVLDLSRGSQGSDRARQHKTVQLAAPTDVTPHAPGHLRRVAWYVGIIGVVSGFLQGYFVLFLVQDGGFSPTRAGAAAATLSVAGILGRLTLPPVAERSGREFAYLRCLGLVGAAAALSMLVTYVDGVGGYVVWAVTLVLGGTVVAVQAIAMLVLVQGDQASVGAASGRTMRTFYLGLLTGPLAAGAIAEASGSFLPVWIGAAGLCLFAVAVIHPDVHAGVGRARARANTRFTG